MSGTLCAVVCSVFGVGLIVGNLIREIDYWQGWHPSGGWPHWVAETCTCRMLTLFVK